MKVVVKGLNYTEVRYRRKNDLRETVMFWALQKERESKKCGVWIDGNQVMDFEDMLDKGFYERKLNQVTSLGSGC